LEIKVIVREATVEDIQQLVELRMQLFAEMGKIGNAAELPELREATRRFFVDAAEDGSAWSWVAVEGVTLIATGTLVVFQRPPYLGNLLGREAYLLNMFTLPSYRGQGIAAQVLQKIMDFATTRGFGKVWLHASAAGRPLYERSGFAPNPAAMEWVPA
jgi:GNAT superfamily N-acetyltransferase